MAKLDDTVQILKDVKFDSNLTASNMAVFFLLGATHLTPEMKWSDATNRGIQIRRALFFLQNIYGLQFDENTLEDFYELGAQRMLAFGLSTNDSTKTKTEPKEAHWFLSADFFKLVTAYGTPQYQSLLASFLKQHADLINSQSHLSHTPQLTINFQGTNAEQIKLPKNNHNQLSKAVLEKFVPNFAGKAELLHIADDPQRDLKAEQQRLTELGFSSILPEAMPDIILYDHDRNRLFLLTATPAGTTITGSHIEIIKEAYSGDAELVFVTVLADGDSFKSTLDAINWGTKIWIATIPEHLVHMDEAHFMDLPD